MIRDIQDEILRLKKEKDICILAHCYQAREILEVADFTGDSFALAKEAAKAKNKTVIMCGVRFMAEGVKLLSPDKTVYLAAPDAGCPMAEQFCGEDVRCFKKDNPEAAIVAYINTSADLKKECDVCVTSSSAVKIVSSLPQRDILFIPDCNLGAYVKANVKDKNITLWQGGCPIHSAVTADEAKKAMLAHPGAQLLVHPECSPEVTALADYIGSTTDIMNYAKNSDANEFIIGTENSIITHLKHECPKKSFYPMSKGLICPDMKMTTITDVLACVSGVGGEIIELDDETLRRASKCLFKMIELG